MRARSQFMSASNRSTGARLGARIGQFLGRAAHGAIGHLFGQGEYKTALANTTGMDENAIVEGNTPEVNTLVEPLSTNHVAMMHSDEEGTVRITRREFVSLVRIQTDELTTLFPINPGLSRDFPWLSQMASAFQQFTICGLAYEYVPTSGYAVSSTNAALGQVVMAMYYEVTDIPLNPIPITTLLNLNGAVSCSPAATGICYLECKPDMVNQSTRFIQTDFEVPNQDYSAQNYYPAQFVLSTSGAQNATPFQAGQLWVTYDIILKQPIPEVPNFGRDITRHERFAPYLEKYNLYRTLRTTVGPLTPDEWVVLRCELRRLQRSLLDTPCQDAIEMIRMARVEEIVCKQQEKEVLDIKAFLAKSPYAVDLRHERTMAMRVLEKALDDEFERVPLVRDRTDHSVR